MASNFEDFVIRFGFNGDKTLRDIKGFLNNVEKLQNKLKPVEIKRKIDPSIQKEIDLIKKRNQLRDSITRAQALGVETKSFEATLSRAKKIETITQRTVQLNEIISKQRLKQAKSSKEMLEADRKSKEVTAKQKQEEARIKEQLRQQLAEEKKKTLEKKKQLAIQERINRSVDRFVSTRSFARVRASDPQHAEGLRSTFATLAATSILEVGESASQARKEMATLRHRVADTAKAQKKLDSVSKGLAITQRGLNDSTRNLIRSYASLFAIFEATTAINRIGQDFEGMRAAMLAASGGAVQAQQDLDFVRQEAIRLGLDLRDTTNAFVKLQFAARGKLAKSEVRELLTGFSEFATAMQVDRFRFEKGLLALTQMMNKGQVMAEELKNQLGEQIPGAVQIFAEALGVTEVELFKMMERGELLAKDVLPLVGKSFANAARLGGALDAALETARISQQRATAAFQEAADVVFQSGFGEGITGIFKELTESLQESQNGLKGLGKFFKLVFGVIETAISVLTPVLDSLFFTLGKVADGWMLIAQVPYADIAAGIGLITIAMRTVLGPILAVIAAFDELLALFTAGRIGVIEAALGIDFGQNEQREFVGTKLKTVTDSEGNEVTIIDEGNMVNVASEMDKAGNKMLKASENFLAAQFPIAAELLPRFVEQAQNFSLPPIAAPIALPSTVMQPPRMMNPPTTQAPVQNHFTAQIDITADANTDVTVLREGMRQEMDTWWADITGQDMVKGN